MIPPTPDIKNMIKPDPIKRQAALSLSALINPSPRGKGLRLPPTENPPIDKNARMIGT